MNFATIIFSEKFAGGKNHNEVKGQKRFLLSVHVSESLWQFTFLVKKSSKKASQCRKNSKVVPFGPLEFLR